MLAILLLCSVSLTFAKTNQNHFGLSQGNLTKPSTHFGLPSSASLVVPNIETQFSCAGKPYGYYADVNNNCRTFHVCQPSKTARGESVIYQFTKFCPHQTQFDQKLLNCQSLYYPYLLPCERSVQYYPLPVDQFSGTQFEGQQKETFVEQTPEVEQIFEQTQFEEQVPEIIPVKVESVLPPPKGFEPIHTPVTVNNPHSTKNIIRSESVEVVQQPNIPVAQPVRPQNVFVETSQPLGRVPFVQTISQSVAPHSFSVESGAPVGRSQTVQTVSQVVPPQPSVSQPEPKPEPQSQLEPHSQPEPQPELQSEPQPQPIFPFESTETVVASQPVEPVAPTPFVAEPGLVGPDNPARSSKLFQTTPNQSVVPLRRNPVFQSISSQANTPFRSVPQLTQSISNEGVISQPILSPYNPFPSQLVSAQSPQVAPQVVPQVVPQTVPQIVPQTVPQVVPQVYGAPHYSVPHFSVEPVVTQNFVPQPVVSHYSIPLNGIFSSQGVVSQPVVPVVSTLLKYNQPYINVVRPAQNPGYNN